MDSTALTKAWGAVFEQVKVESLEDYEAQGWMTYEGFARALGITIDTARHKLDRMHKSGVLEHKKIRVTVNGGARTINIYRPQS